MWNKFMNHDQALEEILDDYEEASKSFKPNYLPEIERISNGTIFVKNSDKFVVPNIGSESFMDSYIFLDAAYRPIRPSYEDYTELPKTGYLLKVRLRRPYMAEQMEIQYILDIEHVKVIQSMESAETIALMFRSESLPEAALSMEAVYEVVQSQKEYL